MPTPGVQVCPFHSDESVRAIRTMSETAEYVFVCTRRGHPSPGSFEWPAAPETVGVTSDSLGLGLDIELPRAIALAIAEAGEAWVEYGLIERAYGISRPDDWADVLQRFDHTHLYRHTVVTRSQLPYTASMYLARTLGELARRGQLAHRRAPGTGRWAYNNPISVYGKPGADPNAAIATWEVCRVLMGDYMPVQRPR